MATKRTGGARAGVQTPDGPCRRASVVPAPKPAVRGSVHRIVLGFAHRVEFLRRPRRVAQVADLPEQKLQVARARVALALRKIVCVRGRVSDERDERRESRKSSAESKVG